MAERTLNMAVKMTGEQASFLRRRPAAALKLRGERELGHMKKTEKIKSRRNEIIRILESTPIASTSMLVSYFGVSKETIRKDLQDLERAGTVALVRGGASLVRKTPSPIPYQQRQELHHAEKAQVARAASRLVQEGDSLLLESSTTTEAFCRELLQDLALLKTLTVVTNSIYIAQMFGLGELVDRLFLLGGWIRPSEGASHGTFIDECLDKLLLDKAFLSGAALDDRLILSAYFVEDMVFQQKAIRRAKRSIILLDKGKYPSSGIYYVDDLESVDCLVTDTKFSDRELAVLKEKHVELVQA